MSFNDTNLTILLGEKNNKFLLKEPKDKYKKFKDKDPFPEINSALLNSEDIIKYILTTGMIDPFVPANLQGATYACTFSGTYLRFSSDGEREINTLSDDDDELCIKSNSITYLEINERFMIPLYMVLRFNLKVPHVYKGLLLGTGPIVDPGFVGRLYIPLHNLTLNEYIIKKGAELISVEFTKLSLNENWTQLNSKDQKIIDILDFSCLPLDFKKKIKPDRGVFEYLKKSLQGDSLFYKKPKDPKDPKDKLSVGSSLEDNVKRVEDLDKRFKDSMKDLEKVKKKVSSEVKIAIFGLVIAVCAILVPIIIALDAIQKERVEYRDEINVYQEKINNLENRLIELEIESKREKAISLEEEYTLYFNRDDSKAIEIYKQISNLENEISELEKQLH